MTGRLVFTVHQLLETAYILALIQYLICITVLLFNVR